MWVCILYIIYVCYIDIRFVGNASMFGKRIPKINHVPYVEKDMLNNIVEKIWLRLI